MIVTGGIKINANMMKGMGIMLVLIVAVAGIWMFASGYKYTAATPGVEPPSQADQASACPVAEYLSVKSLDFAKPGTGVASTSYVYNADGSVRTSGLANDTAHGISGYSTYTVLADGTNMFANKVQKRVGCNGNELVTVQIPQADTGATITFINSDGVTVNAAAANESVTAGQAIDPTIKVKNSAQFKYVTSPFCAEYVITVKFANVSAWDLSKSTISGCTTTTVPVAEAGASHQAFKCSAPDGVTSKFQGDIRAVHMALQATGTVWGTAGDDTITFKVYPEDNVPHSMTGQPMGCVVENDVGTVAQTAITSGGSFIMR